MKIKNRVERVFWVLLFVNTVNLFPANIVLEQKKEEPKANFIVLEEKESDQKLKKLSKNRLKENIGASIKDTLHDCAQVSKLIGKIQIELSEIQEQLFQKVEQLVDNEKVFSSASKQDLLGASSVMNKVKLQVNNQVKNLQELKSLINKDKCLKKS